MPRALRSSPLIVVTDETTASGLVGNLVGVTISSGNRVVSWVSCAARDGEPPATMAIDKIAAPNRRALIENPLSWLFLLPPAAARPGARRHTTSSLQPATQIRGTGFPGEAPRPEYRRRQPRPGRAG